jgi:hypothetical protein
MTSSPAFTPGLTWKGLLLEGEKKVREDTSE